MQALAAVQLSALLHWLHSLPRVVECERQPLGWIEVGCTRAYRDMALPTTNSQHRESFVRESDLSSIDQTQHSTPDSRQADRQAGRQAGRSRESRCSRSGSNSGRVFGVQHNRGRYVTMLTWLGRRLSHTLALRPASFGR